MIKKETDLALKIVEWPYAQNWDVYQEVQINSSVADIVAVYGQLVWVIECKLSLSLELIGQAVEWVKMANFVSIAIPKQKGRFPTKGRDVAKKILDIYGIGVIEVRRDLAAEINSYRDHSVKPRLNRKARTKYVKDSLCDQQKHWAPAGSQSGHYTPFKQTCRRLASIVNESPGILSQGSDRQFKASLHI